MARQPRARAKTAPKKPVSKDLAVIPKTPLEQDFERILAEMHKGFDRVQAEALANLDKIGELTDFDAMREQIDTQFDIIEQAGAAERAKHADEHGDPSDGVLVASVDFAAANEALADAAQRLATVTYDVRRAAAAGSAVATMIQPPAE